MDRASPTCRLWRFPLPSGNIDLLGSPTSAACPAFNAHARASAHVVQKLLDAGAIAIGKTIWTSLPPVSSARARPTAHAATASIRNTSAAALRAVRRSRSRWVLQRLRSARTRPVPVASPRHSTICSATSPRWACSVRAACCRPAAHWIRFQSHVDCGRRNDSCPVATGCDPPTLTQSRATRFPRGWFQRASFRFTAPAPAARFFGNDEYARLYERAIGRLVAIGGIVLKSTSNRCLRRRDCSTRTVGRGRFISPRKHDDPAPDALLPVRARSLQACTSERTRAFAAQYSLQPAAFRGGIWKAADVRCCPTAAPTTASTRSRRSPSRSIHVGHLPNS